MHTLYVLYDSSCGLCVRAAKWLRDEPGWVQIRPIPAASQKAANLFPSLARPYPPLPVAVGTPGHSSPPEVIAIADTGEVYRGVSAWIMCLWATRRYRRWSLILARPRWRPLTTRVIEFLGDYRIGLSRFLRLQAESLPDPTCGAPGCRLPEPGVESAQLESRECPPPFQTRPSATP